MSRGPDSCARSSNPPVWNWQTFARSSQPRPGAPATGSAASDKWTQQAHDLVEQLGWTVDPASPLLDRLGVQLRAAYLAAEANLATLPDDLVGALRQVVLGTALIDPVIATLRRLAQQDEAVTSFGRRPSYPPQAQNHVAINTHPPD